MSNLKKLLLGFVVCLTTALPIGLQAAESVKITNATIQENSSQDVSNVHWRGGWGRGYGFGLYSGYGYGGYGGYYGRGYGYSSYPYSYGYGYSYPSYGYGYGYDGGCSSCNSWWY